MRMSRLFGKTLRNAPAEAETPNHQLMLRAGLVQQLAAGIYSYLPTGWKVMRKIEQIIREEMDRAGGQEVVMPACSPPSCGSCPAARETMRDVLFHLKDRRERDFVLGPTHEEVVVDLFKKQVQSYRDMPLMVYQIQTKLRDEARPRGGLMRVREFTMKDAYSFDDELGDARRLPTTPRARPTSASSSAAASRPIPVQADSGAIGGKDSEEFMFLADSGEDTALFCENGDYAANDEKADHKKRELPPEDPLPLEEVSTPGQKTIDDLVKFLGVPHEKTLKAVFYEADGEPVFVAIRGDLEVNEVEARATRSRPSTVALLDDAGVRKHGLVAGSASPVGLEGHPHRRRRHRADVAQPRRRREQARRALPQRQPRPRLERRHRHRHLARARGRPLPALRRPPRRRSAAYEMGHVFKLGTVYTEKTGRPLHRRERAS